MYLCTVMKQTIVINPTKKAVKQFDKIVNWHMKRKVENRKRIAEKIASIKS